MEAAGAGSGPQKGLGEAMSKLFKSRKFLTAVLAVVVAALDAFAIKAELIGQVEGVGVMILDALVALGFIAGTAYEDGKIIPHQIQGDAQITSDPSGTPKQEATT